MKLRALRSRNASAPRDRGSGSVWLLAMCFVLAVVAIGSVALGGAIVARHRAGAAADLAALAAAERRLDAGTAPCAAAAEVAAAMRVDLVRCDFAGDLVDVVVALDVRIGQWDVGRVEAEARAGPTLPHDHTSP